MASVKLLVLAAVLAAVVPPQAAYAQISTGQKNVCCAYILKSAGGWQLVCNNPNNIPGAMRFPAGTIVSGRQLVPGVIAQCVGRFPFPNPSPYRLPPNGVQLFTPPNGGRCAGQFSRFYQGLGPDGGFVVQCTN